MMLHTLTLTPDAETQTKLAQLMHGDVVAKPNGTYRRVVLRDEANVITLGFPKRMAQDVDATFADYVSKGKVLVVGRVTERTEPTAPKAPAKRQSRKVTAVDSTDDAHDHMIAERKAAAKLCDVEYTEPAPLAKPKAARFTKSVAADAVSAIAEALTAQAAALQLVAEALR